MCDVSKISVYASHGLQEFFRGILAKDPNRAAAEWLCHELCPPAECQLEVIFFFGL